MQPILGIGQHWPPFWRFLLEFLWGFVAPYLLPMTVVIVVIYVLG